jgi:hypothetical protein
VDPLADPFQHRRDSIIGTPVPPDLPFDLCTVCERPTTLMCQRCAQWLCILHGSLNLTRMAHGHGVAVDCRQPGTPAAVEPAPVVEVPALPAVWRRQWWAITYTDVTGTEWVWALTDEEQRANECYWLAVNSDLVTNVAIRPIELAPLTIDDIDGLTLAELLARQDNPTNFDASFDASGDQS